MLFDIYPYEGKDMHPDLVGYGYDWNEGKPDHEGKMAVSQLHRINDMTMKLLDMIGEYDELPAWVQYKLGRSYDDMSDLFGYIESLSHVPISYDSNGMMETDIDIV
jgi:hypothetical protein